MTLILNTKRGGSMNISNKVVRHLKAHPGIIEIIPEVLSKVNLPGDRSNFKCSHRFEKVVGKSGLILTKPITLSEITWFAQRNDRLMPSRVIPDSSSIETDIVSLIATPAEDNSYELVSAWFGEFAPKEPWDPDLASDPPAYEESIHFWCSHGLVYTSETMLEPFESTWGNILKMTVHNN